MENKCWILITACSIYHINYTKISENNCFIEKKKEKYNDNDVNEGDN